MVKVLDASALICYLEKEAGYEKVKNLLAKAVESERNLLMATINWGEVNYILVRDYGLQEADKVLNLIDTFPIEFVPADLTLTRQAAFYRATKKLPYVDCFAVALTKLRKGELITGDREFKVVKEDIKISWV